MNNKIRIAIYSRKSKYSDKGNSIGNQIEIAKEYIKQNFSCSDIDLKIFEDEGFSGSNFKRPEFKKFLLEERKNPFDLLICYRLDRISRNIADFSNLINELNKLGTNFVSIKEQFDTKTPMGRAMMYIASVFAQLEREVIAERIRDNLLELSKTGTWLGGDTPLGYSAERFKKVTICDKDDENKIFSKNKFASKLIINDKEMPIVKLLFSKYNELKSLTKLETYLINNDIKTRRGVYYSIFSLKLILSNPVYAPNDKDVLKYFESKGIEVYYEKDDRSKLNGKYGFLTYNKTEGKKNVPQTNWIVAIGLHQPIIEAKEWINTQILLEKNSAQRYRRASNPKKQTIVSGLIKCKNCGAYMRPKNIDKKRSDGSVNYRYCCQLKEKSKGEKCKSKNVNGEEIDNEIIKVIERIFIPNSYIFNELKKLSFSQESNPLYNEISQNIKQILDDSFNIFDFFDLKTKRDIASFFIEEIYANGEEVEIILTNKEIDEFQKKFFIPTYLKKDCNFKI